MNCKQGDIAVQIAAGPVDQNAIGTFYDVATPCRCHHGAWICIAKADTVQNVSLLDVIALPCRAGTQCCVWDHHLKPIRGTTPPVASPAPSKELEKT